MEPNLPELPVYTFTPTGAGIFSLILTILLPLVVAVITTRVTHPGVKFMLLLFVVGIKTTIEAVVANNSDYINFAWVPFLMNLIINMGIAIAAHFGVWKPTGAAASIQDNVGVKARIIEGEPYTR